MAFDRHLIAPINTGLENDLKPWLTPEDSFTNLSNAYVFRGRLRKRFGSFLMGTPGSSTQPQLYSRLRINIGTTNSMTGDLSGTVPGSAGAIGQLFSIGDAIYTVYQASGTMYKTVATTTATFNTANGDFVFAGAAHSTPVYWYPSNPVMGLCNYEAGPIDNQPSYAFDTQFAYVFAGGFWNRTATDGNPIFHGNDVDFFWTSNWRGLAAAPNQTVLFATNNYVANPNGAIDLTDDPIWSYSTTGGWFPFQPEFLNAGNYVQTAQIIVAFKDRFLLLNTTEVDPVAGTNMVFPQRCRFSYSGSPFDVQAMPGTTDGSGNASGIVAGGVYNVGQRFIIGSILYTVTNSAGGVQPMSKNGPTTTATYDVSTGAYNFVGAPANTQIYFFPFIGSNGPIGAWLEPNQTGAAGAGWVDAYTEEQIISAEFIKDRLIVYFERSTFELVYTGNQVLPFVWQKLNTELGSEALLSSVPFDKVVLTIGTTGVHACNGSNIERIDDKIPETIFQISTQNDGIARVAGIRDYETEMVYWTFPVSNAPAYSSTFPTKVFLYNYKNGSWAFNDDCITAWGYFEQEDGLTWAGAHRTWASATVQWNSGTIQPDNRKIIAGNQQGFVLIVDPDLGRNSASMQITAASGAAMTIINHSLNPGDFIYIENCQGSTNMNGGIVQVATLTSANAITIVPTATYPGFSGTYTGGGTVARVSQIDIVSKVFNPYIEQDRNFYLQKIDFLVDRTAAGQVQINFYPSSSNLNVTQVAAMQGTLLGTGILETSPYDVSLAPLEQEQDRLWHPVYLQAEGNGVQVEIMLSNEQMLVPAISMSGFQLHALLLYTTPTTSRAQ